MSRVIGSYGLNPSLMQAPLMTTRPVRPPAVNVQMPVAGVAVELKLLNVTVNEAVPLESVVADDGNKTANAVGSEVVQTTETF